MRLIVDTFSYCGVTNLPNWNTISISGYHIRGKPDRPAVQEIAFTLANGIAYVEAALAAGMDIDAFKPFGCRFSGTPTTTSSRRWRSTGPPGACGPAS